jgi:hypothetical protein
MRPTLYSAATLIALLQSRRIASMADMKEALGTSVDLTVLRKLKALGYRSSYSHRGRFYTLERVAEFDSRGLWSSSGVHFSRWGTLKDTARHFVRSSLAGHTVPELDRELQVATKEPLLDLFRAEQVRREKAAGGYVYLSAEEDVARAQLAARTRVHLGAPAEAEAADSPGDQLKAAIVLFLATLDEKQRRLYAGLEALKLGHGGDRMIADLLGLDVHTVARGRRELVEGEVAPGRVRQAGGGRPRVEKKRPT